MKYEELEDNDILIVIEGLFAEIQNYFEKFPPKSNLDKQAYDFFKEASKKYNSKEYSYKRSFIEAWSKFSVKKKSYKCFPRVTLLAYEFQLYEEMKNSTKDIRELLKLKLENIEELKNVAVAKWEKKRNLHPKNEILDFEWIRRNKTPEEVEEQAFEHNENIRVNIGSIIDILFSSLSKIAPWLEVIAEFGKFATIRRPRE